MPISWRRAAATCALVGVTLAASSCRGASHNDALHPTTTAAKATTSTAPSTASVLGATLDNPTTTLAPSATTTTAKPGAAPATTVVTSAPAANVNDAPRDAHTETSDNGGTVTYSATPSASATAAPKDTGPLEFTLECHVAPDGHGECNVHLVNHVTRTAQFPGGLKITVTMQRPNASPVQFVFAPGNVPSLAPGEEAFVEGTIDLFDQGTYSYAATTTVAWP
jgi:hypothetical protein